MAIAAVSSSVAAPRAYAGPIFGQPFSWSAAYRESVRACQKFYVKPVAVLPRNKFSACPTTRRSKQLVRTTRAHGLQARLGHRPSGALICFAHAQLGNNGAFLPSLSVIARKRQNGPRHRGLPACLPPSLSPQQPSLGLRFVASFLSLISAPFFA